MHERRISDRLNSWIEDAVSRNRLGEDLWWDSGLVVLPQGVTMGISVWMPSLILGQSLVATAAIPNPVAISEDEVNDLIRQLIEQMREQRSRQAVSSNGQGSGGLSTP